MRSQWLHFLYFVRHVMRIRTWMGTRYGRLLPELLSRYWIYDLIVTRYNLDRKIPRCIFGKF